MFLINIDHFLFFYFFAIFLIALTKSLSLCVFHLFIPHQPGVIAFFITVLSIAPTAVAIIQKITEPTNVPF